MENNKSKNGWGGKRGNSGRNGGKGILTKAMSLKLDNDLYDILVKHSLNKNRYINDAVRSRMEKEGIIEKMKEE